MHASYNLRDSPASFNFVEFLIGATTNGANHVILDLSQGAKKFKDLELEERIHSILIPACEIAGVSWEFGKSGDWSPPYHISAVLQAYKKNGFIKKLESKTKGNFRYTVTLRNYYRYSEKNSTDEWRVFAEDIGARVIEDYYDEPIDLKKRLSLYAGAQMNYFVANGPVVMCLFSDYPYTAFINPQGKWKNYHIEHGWYRTQLPWANENQKVIWSDFSLDSIREKL